MSVFSFVFNSFSLFLAIYAPYIQIYHDSDTRGIHWMSDMALWMNRFAEGKSDKEILDHLLKNSRYDKRLLPPVDGKFEKPFGGLNQ